MTAILPILNQSQSYSAFMKNLFYIILTATFLGPIGLGCAPVKSMDTYYAIETSMGRLVIGLYDETPLHRDNFKKLADEQFYDGTTFHRVIAGFMIQGGDPNSKDDDLYNDGMGGPGYTIEAEITSALINRRGALVAARQGNNVNPERRSSGSQFYIVQGRTLTDDVLDQTEKQIIENTGSEFAYTEAQRETYKTAGGAPWLDMEYSVFGELVEGFDVLDAISAVGTPGTTGEGDRALADMPLEKIEMTVTYLPDYSPSK